MFVPFMPLMLTMGSSVEPAFWKLVVPVLGQHILITEVLEANTLEPLSFLIAAFAAVSGAVVFLALTARLFRRERIVFGR